MRNAFRLSVFFVAIVAIFAIFPSNRTSAAVLYNGTFQNGSFSWTLDNSGILTITGEGQINDFANADSIPWAACKSEILTVVLNGNINSIGSNAFNGCSNLQSIKMPTVYNVGKDAFKDCSSLTLVALNNGINNLESAFPGVSDSVFHYYYTVNYISEHGTVEGSTKTYGTEYLQFIVTPENGYICDGAKFDDGVTNSVSEPYGSNNAVIWRVLMPEATGTFNIELLYKKDYGRKCGDNLTWDFLGSTLYIIGKGRMYDFDYTDPNGNTESNAPWNKYGNIIEKVILDSGITYIGKYAFYGLSSLETVNFNTTILEIGDYAFAYCRSLRISSVPNDTTFGKYVFSHCESLTSFQMPSKMTSITTGLFSYCSNLQTVDFYDTITKIEPEAFWGCHNLNNITIPGKVKSIGANAFRQCSVLESITLPSGITSIPEGLFYECTSLREIVIPSGVKTIGKSAFYGCSHLSRTIVPYGVTSIGEKAFLCGGTVIVNKNIYTGETAFYPDNVKFYYEVKTDNGTYGAITIKSHTMPNDKYNWSYYTDEFEITVKSNNNDYKLDEVTLNYADQSIKLTLDSSGKCVFEMPDIDETVTVKATFMKISHPVVFGTCGENLNWILDDEGTLTISGSGKMEDYVYVAIPIPKEPATGEGGSEGSGEGTGEEEVEYEYKLKTPWIEFKDSIKSIVFSETGITSIGNKAFEGLTGVTSVTISNGVLTIGEDAFLGCTALKSVTVPDSVTKIGDGAFENCSGLVTAQLPDSDTFVELGKRAFNHCSSLTGIVIPGGLKTIKEKTFAGCEKLTDVWLGSVTAIDENAFNGCISLRSVNIPACTVGKNAFANCTSLQWANLSSGFSCIGECMFYNCTKLRLVHLSDALTKIGPSAFEGCDRLTTLYGNYYENLETIGDRAFYGCPKLESITFSQKLQSIGVSAFYGCSSLESVSIPKKEGITIKASAFENCTGLKNVTLGEGLEEVSEKTFAGCTGIKSVIIPYTVSTVSTTAFDGCTALEYVIMNRSTPEEGFAFTNTDCAIHYFYPVTYEQDGEGSVIGYGLSHEVGNYLTHYNDEFVVTASPFEGYRILKVTLTIGENTVELKAGTDGNYRYTMPDFDDEIIVKAYFKDTPTLASGTCGISGNNLTWTIRYNGELKISGYGNMADWQSAEEVPWNEYRNAIRFVTLSDGVTSIGGYAFSGCKDMETVKVPYGVTTIGKDAFAGCKELEYILLNRDAFSQEAFPEIPSKVIHYYSVVNYTNDGHGIILGKRYTSGNEDLEFEVTPFSSYMIDKVTVEMNGKTETVYADEKGKYSFTVPEENSDITVTATFVEKDYTVVSGTCGQDLTWRLDKYGTLTISGTGAMDSFTESVYAPWYSYRLLIKIVRIEDKVTSIGSRSFAGCTKLGDVGIPTSVTTIGNYAFYGCKELQSAVIPDSVKTLGDGAFSHCENLDFVKLPKNMKSIPAELFDSCSSLKSIDIPSGVTTINKNAFNRCVALSDFKIPDSVKTIGENAFASCISFKKIVIPRTVTGLGKRAFADCLGLEYVAVDKNIYNAEAFTGNTCSIYFYYEVKYTNDGNGTVSGKTYSYCKDEMEFTVKPNSTDYMLEKITLTYGSTTVEIHADENGRYVYTMPDSSSAVTVKASFFRASDRGTCGEKLVWSLSDSGVLTISGEGNMTNWNSEYDVPWIRSYDKITTVYFSGNITSIGNYAFQECKKITSINLPETLTSIGKYAFYRCSGIESIKIPYSVNTVSEGAFNNCAKLSSVVIKKNAYNSNAFNNPDCKFHYYYAIRYQKSNYGTVSGPDMTYGTEVVEFTVTPVRDYAADKVTLTIGDNDPVEIAPDKNGNYTYTMPDTTENQVTVQAAFKKVSNTVAHGTCGEGAVWYLDRNGTLYVSGAGEVTAWKGDVFEEYRDNIKKVVFSGKITSIGSGAFSGCTALTEVTLPDTLTSFGKDAFSNCTVLTSIDIPDGVKTIGESAFSGCTSLANVKLPSSLETVGVSAFAGCKVSAISLPATVKTIDKNAFSGCRYLKSITIPEGVNTIGDGAVSNCISLTGLTIPKSVTSLGKNVWSGDTSIKEISILCSITEIGSRSFQNLVSLTTVNIPDTVRTIGDRAFDGCRSLKSIKIPDSVTSIGEYAFNGCSGMTSVTVGDGITAIPKYAFAGCSSIASINIPESVISIGDYAFSDCSKIKNIKLPEGLLSIGNRSFSHCSGLEDIIFPDGLESIGNYAFQYCGFIDEPLIPSTVTSRGDWIFFGCNKLTSFTIPDGVNAIPDYCFYGFYNLEKVKIPNSVYTIGKWAFAYCTSLTKVTMPDSVSYVGDYAFIYCDKLKNVKLSDSIRTIGASTFEECYSLTTVTLSDDVFSIGKRAFYGCGKLKNFDLPSFAGQLGDEAFYGCKSLTEINLSDYTFKLGNKTFYGCTNLKKVTFPSTLGSIGDQTFYHCESLTGIEIPKSVTSIGEEAFCGCKNLKSILLPDRNLTLGKDAFTGSNKLASVVVNKACYSEDVFGTAYDQKIFHYYYDVAYKNDGNGNIFGDNRSYYNDIIEFEVRPNDGYVINKITLTYGGKTVVIPSSSTTYTYKMPDSDSQVLISVTFAAKKTYNVIVNSNLGGTAYANVHSAAANETISVTTLPYDGYKVGSMTFNGENFTGKPFKMPAKDVTIEVTFVKAEYKVTVTAGKGGTASVDKTKAVLDDIVTITVTPEDGYGVDKVKVNNVVVEDMTFQMGADDVKVEVTFKKLDYSITIDDDGNGTASVEREWANKDDEINITVKPDDGYMLDTITVNGEPITGTTFKMPAEDVTIEVTFKLMEYPVTIKAGEGGTAQVSKTIANVDDEITITVKPDACFELDKITVNGATITGNTFTMLAHKVEVEVTFKAKPHMILPVKRKAPTCEEDGYEAHYKCCICGKCYNDEDGHDPISGPVVLAKLGHDLEKVEAKDPTKTEPGNIEYYRCKRDGCGKLFKDAKGKEPISLEDTVIPAIGHELERVPEVPATCEKPGHIEYYKCTDEGCDKMFRDKFGQKPVTADEIVIPATGHHIEEVKEKAPTCEEDGYKSHFKCSNCGQLYSDAEGNNKISAPEKIDKHGHDLHKVDAKAETYLKDGNIEHYECSRCHKLFSDPDGKHPLTPEDVIIPKKGAALLDEETVINNLKYKVTNPATDGTGTVAIIGNSYKSSSLSIPATIEYKDVIYKVVSIGSKAFNGNKSIKTVSIGSNVTSIGDKAFYGCTKLTKVSGGSSVRTIGSYAFASCSKLKTFTISSKYLSKIGSYAFKKDKKLKTVSIKSTTSLTKAGVKKSLKSSYVKTVKVAKSKVKTYKGYFKKSNSGRSVTVKK